MSATSMIPDQQFVPAEMTDRCGMELWSDELSAKAAARTWRRSNGHTASVYRRQVRAAGCTAVVYVVVYRAES